MNAVIGRFIGGKIELVTPPPADWREGQSVIVEPSLDDNEVLNEQGDDPESIERWIAEWDRMPKPVWTEEDEKRRQEARTEQRAFEIANFNHHAETLKAMHE